MPDKAKQIEGIVGIMRTNWDFPVDCNDGELFTYAEILWDRIQVGDTVQALNAYLANVQTEKLKLPESDAFRDIVDQVSRLPTDFSR